MDDVDIIGFSPEMLLNRDVLYDVYEEEPAERERLLALMALRAKEHGIQKEFAVVIKAFNKADKQLADEHKRAFARKNDELDLDFDRTGKPIVTVENYVTV